MSPHPVAMLAQQQQHAAVCSSLTSSWKDSSHTVVYGRLCAKTKQCGFNARQNDKRRQLLFAVFPLNASSFQETYPMLRMSAFLAEKYLNSQGLSSI